MKNLFSGLLTHSEGSRASTIFAMGGDWNSEHADEVANCERPMVEYMYLEREYGFPILSFRSMREAPRIVQWIRQHGGPYWAMALAMRFGGGDPLQTVIASGEDIGFRMAIVNGLTGAGKRSVAIITHGSYFGSSKASLVLNLIRQFPGVKFLCLSESLREQLIGRFHIPEYRVVNIGYGVDTDFFTPQADKIAPPFQIMSAGMAMRDYKTLAAAARGLPDISVEIAADSAWFRSDLDIEDESLPINVRARSYGNYVNLRQLYADSAFAVVPLYPAVHACGYAVIIEAMAMGKPVITTKIAGRSDLVIEGETGFYVAPGNVEELRERIRFLMDRPDLIRDMGQRARSLIEADYSLKPFSARLAAASAGRLNDSDRISAVE